MLKTMFKASIGKRKSLCAIFSDRHWLYNSPIESVIKKMGFTNIKQYQNSYPGEFDFSLMNNKSKLDYMPTCDFTINSKKQLKSMIKTNNFSGIIIVPTIAEARDSYGFSLTSPYGYDLWFCSDWKGDDE